MTPKPLSVITPLTVHGLGQPLVDVAAVLHVQDRPYHALALREAAWVCEQVSQMGDVIARLQDIKDSQ